MFNKKGLNTVVYITTLFIVLSLVVGYINILSRTHILNEIQANMDNVGLTVLQGAFNRTALRDEFLEIDRQNFGFQGHVQTTNHVQMLRRDYERRLRQITRENDFLLDFQIVHFDVHFMHSRIAHLDNIPRLQIVLDAVVLVTISSHATMTKNNSSISFRDTLGRNHSLSHSQPGNISLHHVRSVVRSVYE